MQGDTGVPGGSVTNEDTSPGPVKTYLRDLGAYKSQLVVTTVPHIYVYIYI